MPRTCLGPRGWVGRLASVLLLVGCWSQSPPVPGGPGNSAGTAPRAERNSVSKPPQDGYLRLPLLTNPPDLDPILISDTTSHGIGARIFNTLVAYDEQLALVPSLAETMPEVSPDGRVYTFTLRRGVKFHHGRELVAQDVKYSLSRLATTVSKRFNVIEPIFGAEAARQSSLQGTFTEITGIETPHPHRVVITLNKPYSTFLYLMAMTNAAVVPREVIEAKGDKFSRQPVGTGPFRLVEWRENDVLRLERFDDYFLGKPKLAGMALRVIQESLARQKEYEAGNLDLCDVTSGMYQRWKNSNRSEEVLEWPQLTVLYYGFNLEKDGSPYAGRQDERARKLRLAINYAVDREHLCNNVLEGRYTPANGILPPGTLGHDASRPVFKQDVAKARELLAEAGYPEGRGLPPVQLWLNSQGDNALIAQTVQQDLARVGIPIELKQLDWAAFIKATDAGEPAFFRLGWVADYPDPETFLFSLFHSSNKGPRGNVTFYDNPVVDELINQSYAETDPALRMGFLRQAEEQVLQDVPWLFLTFQKEVILRKPYVKNLHPSGMDDDVSLAFVPWHEVAIEPESP
ncbi:MAG: ABC transporter substrate-binding protein [Planctomycetota bacterium]